MQTLTRQQREDAWRDRADDARAKTYARFDIASGSKEAALLDMMHTMHVDIGVTAANGSYKENVLERNEANIDTGTFYAEINKLYKKNTPDSRATAETADAAYKYYASQLNGPTLAQRALQEPYVDKETGDMKWSGFAGLATGVVAGLGLGLRSGGGWIKSIIMAAVVGIAGGVGGSFLGGLFTGDKQPDTPEKPEPTQPPLTTTPELEATKEANMERAKNQARLGTAPMGGMNHTGAPMNNQAYQGMGVINAPASGAPYQPTANGTAPLGGVYNGNAGAGAPLSGINFNPFSLNGTQTIDFNANIDASVPGRGVLAPSTPAVPPRGNTSPIRE